LPNTPAKTPVPAELVLMIKKLDEAPISSKQISNWTQKDPLLFKSIAVHNVGMARASGW